MNKRINTIFFLIFITFICKGQSRNEYIEMAMFWEKKNEFPKAIVIYDEAIEKYKEDAELFLLRGEAKTRLSVAILMKNLNVPSNNKEQYENALNDFNAALKINPDFNYVYHSRGYLHLNHQYYDKAISDYTTFLKYPKLTESDKLRGYINRAACYLRKENFELALEDYKKAKEINPKEYSIYLNISSIYAKQKRYKDAEEYLKLSLSIDSTQYNVWNNLGILKIETEKFNEALPIFIKLYDINPNDPFTLNNLGYTQCKNGDVENGLRNINKSLSIYPDNSFAYKNRGIIYLDLGQKEKACKDFNKAIELGYIKTYGNDIMKLLKDNCK